LKNIENYLNHLKLEGKASNTIETYSYHLNRFHYWFSKANMKIDILKPSDLLDFRENLSLEGKTARTINAVLSCVRGYFDYLILKEIVITNPVSAALTIQVKNIIVEPLTDEQLQLFKSHIGNWKININAAFHLMLATGARVGEVAGLQKGDFKLIDGKLWINIEDAKWGSDRRIPVLYKDSAIIIYKYLETIDIYNAPAFRVSRRTLQTYADQFKNDTGIKFSCHVLRHTLATRLLESGVDIEKIRYMLGHKTNNMTRHYTQTAKMNVADLAPTIWQGDKI